MHHRAAPDDGASYVEVSDTWPMDGDVPSDETGAAQLPPEHVQFCFNRYRSYLPEDNTDQAYSGDRAGSASRQALSGVLCVLRGIRNPVLAEGRGKVPLGPCYVETRDGETWWIRGLDGEVRVYTEVVGEDGPR